MSDNNNDKDAIRARLAAEEKQAAAEAAANRNKNRHRFFHVGLPKFGKRTIAGILAGAIAFTAAGQLGGGVNNSPLAINPPDGGSAIVETFARSMTRELDTGWCPSSSYIFSPSHMRIDMCAFQEGKQEIYMQLSRDLNNHLTRQGNATKIDPDIAYIQKAFSRDNTWSVFSGNSTYDWYRSGVDKLHEVQQNIVSGKSDHAEMYYRIDNLGYMLNSIASNVGSEISSLNQSSGYIWGLLGSRNDYYHALGVMNGTCEVLKAVEKDFGEVIRLQSSPGTFQQAADTACSTMNWDAPRIFGGYVPIPKIVFGPSLANLQAKISTLGIDLQTAQNGLAAQGFTTSSPARRPGFVAPEPPPAALRR